MADVKNWKEKWTLVDAIKFLYSESKKRCKGFGVLFMMIDAAICLLKYGATFHDYMSLRFYLRSGKERQQFLTTGIVSAEKKKWPIESINKVDNKMCFNTLFSDFIGRDWIDLDDCSFDVFLGFVNKHKDFFVKGKRESSGVGIEKYNIDSIGNLSDFYADHISKGFICEEVLTIHDKMKQLNPFSVSQIRVVTVSNGDNVNILATTLRTGGRSDIAFNTAKDDLFIQVDIEKGIGFTVGVDESGNEFEKHPVSGIVLKGFEIPNWEIVLKTCKLAARRVPDVRVIGWDVAITKDGCAFFEGNPGSGVASMQLADGIGKKTLFYKYLGY